ncbi:OTU9, partial [Symbiodinium pilosum]
ELDRLLAQVGKKRAAVVGDGNCQYGSLLESAKHKGIFVCKNILEMRVGVYAQLSANRGFYDNFLDESWEEWVSKVLKDGEWGDRLTLQAFSDHSGIGVRVYKIQPNPEVQDYALSSVLIHPWYESEPEQVLELCNIQAVEYAVNHGLADLGEEEAWARSMSEDGTWADEIAILATSHILGRAILVISLNENTGKLYHTLYGQEEPNQKVIIPVFYNGITMSWWTHGGSIGVFPAQTHEKALRNRYDATALQNMVAPVQVAKEGGEEEEAEVDPVMILWLMWRDDPGHDLAGAVHATYGRLRSPRLSDGVAAACWNRFLLIAGWMDEHRGGPFDTVQEYLTAEHLEAFWSFLGEKG